MIRIQKNVFHDDVIEWQHFLRHWTIVWTIAGNSPVTTEFPSQRPMTRSVDVFFDLRLNRRLSEQSRHRRFEKPSRSLWRHSNECVYLPSQLQTGRDWYHVVENIQLDFDRCISFHKSSTDRKTDAPSISLSLKKVLEKRLKGILVYIVWWITPVNTTEMVKRSNRLNTLKLYIGSTCTFPKCDIISCFSKYGLHAYFSKWN